MILGGFLAIQNLRQEANVPQVMSISLTNSESSIGADYNAYINSQIRIQWPRNAFPSMWQREMTERLTAPSPAMAAEA